MKGSPPRQREHSVIHDVIVTDTCACEKTFCWTHERLRSKHIRLASHLHNMSISIGIIIIAISEHMRSWMNVWSNQPFDLRDLASTVMFVFRARGTNANMCF